MRTDRRLPSTNLIYRRLELLRRLGRRATDSQL